MKLRTLATVAGLWGIAIGSLGQLCAQSVPMLPPERQDIRSRDGGSNIFFSLPRPRWDPQGNVNLAPWVYISPSPPPAARASVAMPPPRAELPPAPGAVHILPPDMHGPPPAELPWDRLPACHEFDYAHEIDSADPIVEGDVTSQPLFHELAHPSPASAVIPWPAWLQRWLIKPSLDDLGLGHERLAWALFEMDPAQPLNQFRVRASSTFDHELPDRAEYFWARTPGGRGPRNPGNFAERSVSYQDVRFLMESGGEKMSVATELPFRWLDPEIHGNTAGLADMTVAVKTVMIDESPWLLSQVFRTYMPTGAASHGLGTGHVSMEPGVLLRYWGRPQTVWHAELKYWFPIAADPNHGGEVLRYGLGVSHVMHESDQFAIIPTLEVVAMSVMDGRKTARLEPLGTPQVIDVDGETIVNLLPGMWIVSDKCNLWEIGVSGGLSVTGDRFARGLIRLDMRFSF